MTTRPLVPFFLLTFILSIPGYVLIYLCAKGVFLTPEMAQSFVPLATLGPLLAAVILIARERGWTGVKALLWRSFDFRRITNKSWYLAMFLLPPVIFLLALSAAKLTGQTIVPASIPLIAAPLAFIVFFGGAASEALGWMGYAFMPMQARWNAFTAALVLGVIITLWHVPLYLYATDDPAFFRSQIMFPIALRVLAVWIFNNTGKSIFATIILHAMFNTGYMVFEANHAFVTGISLIVALGVVYFWGPKTMANFRGRTIQPK